MKLTRRRGGAERGGKAAKNTEGTKEIGMGKRGDFKRAGVCHGGNLNVLPR